jgi:hypothetical protein
MAKAMTTQQSALAQMNGEIDEDAKAHMLPAASLKFERMLHDVPAAAFEAQCKARAEYLAEVAAINEGGDE